MFNVKYFLFWGVNFDHYLYCPTLYAINILELIFSFEYILNLNSIDRNMRISKRWKALKHGDKMFDAPIVS